MAFVFSKSSSPHVFQISLEEEEEEEFSNTIRNTRYVTVTPKLHPWTNCPCVGRNLTLPFACGRTCRGQRYLHALQILPGDPELGRLASARGRHMHGLLLACFSHEHRSMMMIHRRHVASPGYILVLNFSRQSPVLLYSKSGK
jgi:hypothetical protein